MSPHASLALSPPQEEHNCVYISPVIVSMDMGVYCVFPMTEILKLLLL